MLWSNINTFHDTVENVTEIYIFLYSSLDTSPTVVRQDSGRGKDIIKDGVWIASYYKVTLFGMI